MRVVDHSDPLPRGIRCLNFSLDITGFPKPLVKPAIRSGLPLLRTPITGTAFCCARAASGWSIPAAPPARTSRSQRIITMALSSLVKPAAIAGLCNPSGVNTSRAGMTTGTVLGRPVAHPTWPTAQRADLSPPIVIWGTSGIGATGSIAAPAPMPALPSKAVVFRNHQVRPDGADRHLHRRRHDPSKQQSAA